MRKKIDLSRKERTILNSTQQISKFLQGKTSNLKGINTFLLSPNCYLCSCASWICVCACIIFFSPLMSSLKLCKSFDFRFAQSQGGLGHYGESLWQVCKSKKCRLEGSEISPLQTRGSFPNWILSPAQSTWKKPHRALAEQKVVNHFLEERKKISITHVTLSRTSCQFWI